MGLLCGEKQNLATQYFMRFINVQDTYLGIMVKKKKRISWLSPKESRLSIERNEKTRKGKLTYVDEL